MNRYFAIISILICFGCAGADTRQLSDVVALPDVILVDALALAKEQKIDYVEAILVDTVATEALGELEVIGKLDLATNTNNGTSITKLTTAYVFKSIVGVEYDRESYRTAYVLAPWRVAPRNTPRKKGYHVVRCTILTVKKLMKDEEILVLYVQP